MNAYGEPAEELFGENWSHLTTGMWFSIFSTFRVQNALNLFHNKFGLLDGSVSCTLFSWALLRYAFDIFPFLNIWLDIERSRRALYSAKGRLTPYIAQASTSWVSLVLPSFSSTILLCWSPLSGPGIPLHENCHLPLKNSPIPSICTILQTWWNELSLTSNVNNSIYLGPRIEGAGQPPRCFRTTSFSFLLLTRQIH